MSPALTTTLLLLLLLSGIALSVSKYHDSEAAERTNKDGPTRKFTKRSTDSEEVVVADNEEGPDYNIITLAKSFMLHWWKLFQQMMSVLKQYEDAKRTKMLVLDSGSATAYRVDLGADLTDQSVTSYYIPALQGFRTVDWDYLDDRLFILKGDYKTIQSVFVNGTDLRNVTVLAKTSYVMAVEPFDKKIFASMLGLRGDPARVISMDTDGSNLVVLREAKLEAPDMGIDFKNKYLYWTEYLCSCLFRVKYGLKGSKPRKVKKKYSHIYVKQNPRAMDFQNKLLYGDARKGMYKVDLKTEAETLIYTYPSKSTDETVYDPKTNRLFLYNNENSTVVRVLSTEGTDLGTLEGISLTADKRKVVRINPQ